MAKAKEQLVLLPTVDQLRETLLPKQSIVHMDHMAPPPSCSPRSAHFTDDAWHIAHGRCNDCLKWQMGKRILQLCADVIRALYIKKSLWGWGVGSVEVE